MPREVRGGIAWIGQSVEEGEFGLRGRRQYSGRRMVETREESVEKIRQDLEIKMFHAKVDYPLGLSVLDR